MGEGLQGILHLVVLFSYQVVTLCDPMDYSPPCSSVDGIFQTRIPEWVTISFSKGSSQPRDQNWVSCIGRRIDYC